MKTYKVVPRGYCKGVVSAINQVVKARQDYPDQPIYILGMLVHNALIAEALESINVTTLDGRNKSRLELIDEVDHGVVVLTAHGSAQIVKDKAIEKGLIVIDATCVDVTHTYTIIHDALSRGKEILYIGKKHHPESEGAISIDPKHIHLIEKEEDFYRLPKSGKTYLLTNQTTMSSWDVADLATAALSYFDDIDYLKEICQATQMRQNALNKIPEDVDLLFVVGDVNSNNSNKLRQIAEKNHHIEAYLIEKYTDINLNWLKDKKHVAVTSGASTPTYITNQVIEYLERFDHDDSKTHAFDLEIDLSKIL